MLRGCAGGVVVVVVVAASGLEICVVPGEGWPVQGGARGSAVLLMSVRASLLRLPQLAASGLLRQTQAHPRLDAGLEPNEMASLTCLNIPKQNPPQT